MNPPLETLNESLPVSIEQVSKSYGNYEAVKDVSIAVEPGTILSLLGPSGCGKTTVLRMVAGLETPDAGQIRVGNRVLNDVPVWKRKVGIVFQNYALFPHMNVAENIAFGLRMQGLRGAQYKPAVKEAMDLTRLTALSDRLPSQLSGGQRQRVALARAIVNAPTVLLLDEPLGALDKKLRDQMQTELKLLQRRTGLSTIIVTHDQDEALTLSDRVAVMSQGKLEQAATPQEIYRSPKNAFVAGFIGAANLLPARVEGYFGAEMIARLPWGQEIRSRQFALDRIPGEEVTVMMRPENVRLAQEGSDGDNVISGRVLNIQFAGPHIACAIEAHGHTFNVLLPCTEQGREVQFSVDDVVHMRCTAHDTMLVPN